MKKLYFFALLLVAALTGVSANAQDATTPSWVDVTLETPGSLGVEILYKVDKLSDVQYLRINGTMNSQDWATLKNTTALIGLDLSNTAITSVPDEQFQNCKSLQSVILAPSTSTIGKRSFKSTGLVDITIPKSVKSIGDAAFSECGSLVSVAFEEGSELTTVGREIFYYNQSLKSVSLPDGIVSIPNEAFSGCSELESVNLPASLQSIGSYAFSSTQKLLLIDFPKTVRSIGSYAFSYSGLTAVVLPSSLTSLGSAAFYNCSTLTEVDLPASILKYSDQFSNCKAIQKVTCRAATPPTTTSSLFSNLARENVTLCVPDFAIVNYKLDDYWLGFGTIQGGATSDFWLVGSDLSLTNERRMEGNPLITVAANGKLRISGAAEMPIDVLTLNHNIKYYYEEPEFGQVINSSPSVTANSIILDYTYEDYANMWYFFSLPFDANLADVTCSNEAASFVIREYDGAERAASGTGKSWKNLEANAVLKAGKGYIIQSNETGTFSFKATEEGRKNFLNPNAREIELAVNPSENAADAGWNYVGNPYQSYYDMYYTMLTSPIIVWNQRNQRYDALSLIDDEVVLCPEQPFFIQANEDLTSIIFDTPGRQFTTEIARPETRAGETSTRQLVNLLFTFNGKEDATRIVVNEDASLNYESSRDASKFFSSEKSVPQLYTIDTEGNPLAINERPQADGIVRLGVYAPAAGKMSISATRSDCKAELIDNLTGKKIELGESASYEFEVEEAGNIENRFNIHIYPKPSAVEGIESEKNVTVTTASGMIIIEGAAENVSVYAIDGKKVAEREAASTVEIPVAAGVYVVKAGNFTGKCIVK